MRPSVLEGDSQDVGGFRYEGEGDVGFGFFGDFGHVLFVAAGEDDGLDAGAFGGEDFFFQPADGQDQALERDFAGHGDIRAGGFVLSSEDAREVNMATPATGAVFGDGACGDMDMVVDLGELFGVEMPRLLALDFDDGEGRLGGFFHDVADLAGELEVPLPGIAAASTKRISPPKGV